MDSTFSPESASVSARLPGTPDPIDAVMALLDIARLEMEKDAYVAKASITRASALLLTFADLTAAPTTALNPESPHGECRR